MLGRHFNLKILFDVAQATGINLIENRPQKWGLINNGEEIDRDASFTKVILNLSVIKELFDENELQFFFGSKKGEEDKIRKFQNLAYIIFDAFEIKGVLGKTQSDNELKIANDKGLTNATDFRWHEQLISYYFHKTSNKVMAIKHLPDRKYQRYIV